MFSKVELKSRSRGSKSEKLKKSFQILYLIEDHGWATPKPKSRKKRLRDGGVSFSKDFVQIEDRSIILLFKLRPL